jgi:YD repeat-containing protein
MMAVQQTIEATVPALTILQTADQVIGEVQRAGRVTSVSYTPEAAVTGAASPASRTLTCVNKGQAGVGTTTIATLALVGGVDLVAFDEKAITLTATVADRVVAAGDEIVWVSTAVGGTGLVDPGGHVVVEVGATSYTDVGSGEAVAQTQG